MNVLCKDCKWYRARGNAYNEDICMNPATDYIDPVRGNHEPRTCIMARAFSPCGMDGHLFELKVTEAA